MVDKTTPSGYLLLNRVPLPLEFPFDNVSLKNGDDDSAAVIVSPVYCGQTQLSVAEVRDVHNDSCRSKHVKNATCTYSIKHST